MIKRLAVCIVASVAFPAAAEDIVSARYGDPTTRYGHGILGDAVEWGALILETETGRHLRLTLPENRVFEDTAPRLADIDGDGDREVIVVETDVALGARLSVYGPDGLVASNEFIGQTNRWLAPVGVAAADLDGDGRSELAYVDRPHLAKTLRVFRLEGDRLRPVGALEGVTNHRIGETDIAGGIRDCGQGPEMIVASADWTRVLAVVFDGEHFATRTLAPHEGRATFAAAMDCRF